MTEKRRASDVFLDLWQWRALDMTPEEFAEAAGAWRQIVSLEEIYAAAKQKEAMKDFWKNWGTQPVTPLVPADTWPGPITCEARSKVDTNGQEGTGADTDGPEGTGGDTSSGADAPPPAPLSVGSADISPRRGEYSPQGEGITYDCTSAPMTEEAAKAAARSAAGVSSLATRKRRALERLDAARERGISMADVVAAGSGLTLNDVLDAVTRNPLPLPKLAALEKALTKLEEAGQ